MIVNEEYKKEQVKFLTKTMEIISGIWIADIVGSLGLILSENRTNLVHLLIILGLVITFVMPVAILYLYQKISETINDLKDEHRNI